MTTWLEDPRPLEETDPELAEHVRLIVRGEHAVKRMVVGTTTVQLHLREGGVQLVRLTPDTGRNDPCYCGSGKKYKKCCG